MPLNPIDGTPENDDINGTEAGDLIQVYGGTDYVYAGGGDDRIFGGDGSDWLNTGAGDDRAYGGHGADYIYGASGVDWLQGGDGNDHFDVNLAVSEAADTVSGGRGYDSLSIWSAGNLNFDGGTGTDTVSSYWRVTGNVTASLNGISDQTSVAIFHSVERLNITTDSGDDSITGGTLDDFIGTGAGTNHVLAGDGNDFVTYTLGAQNSLDGGEGTDLLRLDWTGNVRVVFTFDTDTGTAADDFGSLITGFETFYVYGSKRNDKVTLGSGDDTFKDLYSDQDDDTVFGGSGNDSISLSRGESHVFGGDGDDSVDYDAGAINRLAGGEGTDHLSIYVSFYPVLLQLNFTADAVSATDGFGSVLTGFEAFSITCSHADDFAAFAAGNDRFSGGYGDDSAYGGTGRDALNGKQDNDVLFGGADADRLTGSSGNDQLDGGDGRDVLSGQRGADTLTGGADADRFILSVADDTSDTILDFETVMDQLAISRFAFHLSIGAGPLDPALFSSGAAAGTGGQFVLVDLTGSAKRLIWDSNGETAGGQTVLVDFSNGVVFAASDILIT